MKGEWLFVHAGVPGIITATWAICNYHLNKKKCWSQSFELSIALIVIAPVVAALTVHRMRHWCWSPDEDSGLCLCLGLEGHGFSLTLLVLAVCS